jgi:hypothetical protein
MAQANLGRLHVNSPDDECGGVQPAQVVEAGALTAGFLGGREPYPPAPVRVAQRTAVIVGENERLGVGGRTWNCALTNALAAVIFNFATSGGEMAALLVVTTL